MTERSSGWRSGLLEVKTLDDFIAAHRRFLLYQPSLWAPDELRKAGGRLTLLAEENEEISRKN